MDFTAIISESWRTIRSARALWVLGLVSAVQLLLYAAVVGLMVAPMAAITQFAVAAQRDSASAASSQSAGFGTFVANAGLWFSAHWGMLAAGAVTLIAVWAVSGVFDVAATAGLITQTDSAGKGASPSVAEGMSDGFRLWWRTVGLLAVAALPTLLYLLILALVTLFTISLPLYRGQLPDPATMRAGNLATTPVSLLVSLASIPLAVIVALGLRFVTLDDLEWREAFGRGWALVKARIVDVAVWYLIVLGFASAISLASAVPISILVIAGLLIAFATGAVHSGGAAAVALVVVFGGACLLLFVIATLVSIVWQSVAWTTFWRHITRVAAPVAGSQPISTQIIEGEPT